MRLFSDRRFTTAAAIFAVVMLAACSDGGAESSPTGSESPTAQPATGTVPVDPGPSATPTADASPGTTSTPAPTATAAPPLPAAVQAILDEVVQIRGLPAPANLRAEVISRAELPEVYNSLLTEEDFELAADLTVLYRLIGFIANDQDYLDIFQSFISDAVLGFYVPTDDKLYVVSDRGDGIEIESLSNSERSTLAHELVHALQDSNFDLDAVGSAVPEGLDPSLAYRAVVEGDAVIFEERYSDVFLRRAGVVPLIAGGTLPQLGIPEPILREEFFPYLEGPRLVDFVVREFGAERLNDLLAEPPTATSYILHPDLIDSGWEPEAVTLPDLRPRLGDEWTLVYGGMFGEFELDNMLRERVRGSTAEDAAEGWSGDAFAVYADGSGSGSGSVAAVRVAFADEAERDEFVAGIGAFADGLKVSPSDINSPIFEFTDGDAIAYQPVSDRDVLIVFASEPSLAKSVIAALLGG